MPVTNLKKSPRSTQDAARKPRSQDTLSATKIVQIMGELPTMPIIAAQIMEKLGDPCSTPRQIQDLITKDQGLSVRVLRVANSPYYGASRSISTIKDAVLFLGYDSIRSLIMTAVLKGMFSALSLSEQLLWEHAVCCGFAARRIGAEVGYDSLDEAYLAGLMHDIGKAVLFLRVPAVMREIMLEVEGGKSEFVDLERKALGFTHAEVGQIMADSWFFSMDIEDAIAHHHCPDHAGSARELSYIVNMADGVCHKFEIGPTRRPDIDLFELDSTKVMGLDPAAVSRILESVETMLKEESISL
jgi:HD-like signal output (HDOD) protein